MEKQSKIDINELIQQISALIPADVTQLREDVEKNIRSTLTAGLHKMELVTREEFDTQSAVLQKTRTLLNDLQEKIEDIESRLD